MQEEERLQSMAQGSEAKDDRWDRRSCDTWSLMREEWRRREKIRDRDRGRCWG